eukprot:s842_g12.t1
MRHLLHSLHVQRASLRNSLIEFKMDAVGNQEFGICQTPAGPCTSLRSFTEDIPLGQASKSPSPHGSQVFPTTQTHVVELCTFRDVKRKRAAVRPCDWRNRWEHGSQD